MASATSKQTEIHLTNVARSSLGELLEDYKDFLRLRDLPIWDKDAPRMLEMRALSTDAATYETYRPYIESRDPEIVGNIMVCLCQQACFLLDQQKRELEAEFLKKGGIRERMTRARLEMRGEKDELDAPQCPKCKKPMRRRTARQGPHVGRPFWGCSGYPECRGTRPA